MKNIFSHHDQLQQQISHEKVKIRIILLIQWVVNCGWRIVKTSSQFWLFPSRKNYI